MEFAPRLVEEPNSPLRGFLVPLLLVPTNLETRLKQEGLFQPPTLKNQWHLIHFCREAFGAWA